MEEVKYYKSNDGTLFTSKEKCKEYENKRASEIIADFRSLIVRENDGMSITKEASAFPCAEVGECWAFCAFVMHDKRDYAIAKRYAELVKYGSGCRIPEIYDVEIIAAIGDCNPDKNGLNCKYNWFYCWGTIGEVVDNYYNAMKTFGIKEERHE